MADHAPRLRARLDHIAINSPEPERMAEFYRLAMDLRLERLSNNLWLCEAPRRRLLIVKGEAKTLAFGAYAVDEPDLLAAVRKRVVDSGAKLERSESSLLTGDSLMVKDPDGNRIAFGMPVPEKSSDTPALPARLQHLVFGSDEVSRIADFYERVLGFTVSDRVFDKTGKLTNCFFRADRGDHHILAIFPSDQKKLDHHCYESIDWGSIRDWADQLSSRGVSIAWGPGRHGPGANLFIMVRDPDGNWVEISAELEQVEAEHPAGVWEHGPLVANRWGQPRLTV